MPALATTDNFVEDVSSGNEDSDFQIIPEEPKPVPIVIIDDENHNFKLDEEALSKILLDSDVVGLPVAVVSVAGAFRKGKSFLLNFFIRY